jgi:hypothetical protein
MTKGDLIVERGAAFLEELSRKAASEGGIAAKLAEPLAEDAVFLRKLKPSLVRARLRGEPATDGHVSAPTFERPVPEPPKPEQPAPKKASGGGPKALVVVGAAFVVGVLVAKVIDWRGHAHPRG